MFLSLNSGGASCNSLAHLPAFHCSAALGKESPHLLVGSARLLARQLRLALLRGSWSE